MKAKKAFSLVEILVALAILGIVTAGIAKMMDSINVGLKSQKDIEMRTELFQILNRIKNTVDCSKTMSSAPPLPTSGSSPVTVYRRGASTAVEMINQNGSNFGRFSIVANLMSSNEIRLQAASFKTAPTSPRDHLNDPESAFTKKKTAVGIWDWNTAAALINKEFSELGAICSASAANAFEYPDFDCPAGTFISKFKNGVPVCEAPIVSSSGGATTTTTSAPSTTKWLLDRDCVSSAPDCSACQQLVTAGTCPANPGGLSCSSPGGRCVTPQGCRRYVCN